MKARRTSDAIRFLEIARIRRFGALVVGLLGGAGALGCEPEGSSKADGIPEDRAGERGAPSSADVKPAATSVPAPEPPRPACPAGMNLVPGGTVRIGSLASTYEQEENPRFTTRVAEFCADVTEVTTGEYEACVARGACTAAEGSDNKTCNSSAKGRAEHPINCIRHDQAVAVCAQKGARLPTEVEWEYLARGGAEMRKFPWGEASPDGRTCWKNHESCPVTRFEAGAFGLRDVVGNVWEWTDDWFAPYPWPAATGRHKVFRGGSWSRRFEKWLSPTLRNRVDPKKWGSHLGVRCVADSRAAVCPYGEDESKRCRFGVDAVDCLDGLVWNGARCARSLDEPRCAPGSEEVKGHGCVRARVSGPVDSTLDTSAVARARSPEFDEDCRTNQPSRPLAYRYTGGEHLARNAVGKADGCKNRDVGVGWNSACCPN